MSNFAEKQEEKAVKMSESWHYAQALSYMNPQALVIERYQPPATTAGGLIKPQEYREKEGRSTVWGKLIRMSYEATDDQDILRARETLCVGCWVNFLATNPIKGGYDKNKQIQIIAVQDILIALNDDAFQKYIQE